MMTIIDVPEIPGLRIAVARTFWQRLVGLLGQRALAIDTGLLLVPCNNIHTAFMLFAIDVVFLDRSGRVLAIVPQLPPFRMAALRAAHACLELSGGAAARYQLRSGQPLTLMLRDRMSR